MPEKSLDEIALDIVHAMAAVDVVYNDLVALTNPHSAQTLQSLTTHRGMAISALACFEGYHLALRGVTPKSIIEPGRISKSQLKHPGGRPFGHRHQGRNQK
jgi:hypothetical protein